VTRIIGGQAGGRRLDTPKGALTRPTSDRVREALFSAVESALGSLAGLRVLDLYAGSGAVGLEAWSRGAAWVTLVEQHRRTAALVAANARRIGCEVAEVVAEGVAHHLSGRPAAPYDLVYLDPPYSLAAGDVVSDLQALADGGWLTDDALVVVERSAREPAPAWPRGFQPGRVRTYGETSLSFGTWHGLWYGRDDPPPALEEP
jgi:16S rRNA (guanine966-N2)-methyltransferase